MSLTEQAFETELAGIREGLLREQGQRMRKAVNAAFDAFFTHDRDRAQEVIDVDDEIDDTDVEVERRAVELLTTVAAQALPLEAMQLRRILTCVKVNNEYERIADAAVTIAERVLNISGSPVQLPATTRVMTNSVIGIVRDMAKAFDESDATLARLVLKQQDTIGLFKAEILRQAEASVAAGDMGVDLAFDLHEVTSQCILIADHATNVAEQVIWEATGFIVRHADGKWVEKKIEERGAG
ncbi:MAG: PhoU domain-containing protein [Planctomycetota bacterium]